MNEVETAPMEKRVKICFQIMGVIPFFPDTSWSKLYTSGVFIFLFLGFASVTWTYKSHDDIANLAEKTYLTISVHNFVAMNVVLYLKRHVVENVFIFLSTPLKDTPFSSYFTSEQEEYYKEFQLFCGKVNKILVPLYYIGLFLPRVTIEPIAHMIAGSRFEDSLPYAYPFTISNYKEYAVILFIQTVVHFLLTTLCCAIAGLYINCILIIHAHCHLLCESLENIEQRTMDVRGHELAPYDSKEKSLEKTACNIFHACIKWHILLKRVFDDLQELYYVVIAQFIVINFMVSLGTGVFVFRGTGSIQEHLPQLILMIMCLMNLFVICLMGEILSSSSSNIRVSSYNSFWINRSRAYTSSVTIFAEAVKKPFILRTPFCKVRLDTFTNMMSALYSYHNTFVHIDQHGT